MYKYKIELVTASDARKFVEAVTPIQTPVKLTDGEGFCVNGKSLLGASLAAIEWSTLYCVSDEDIYTKIRKFCAT